MKDPEFIDMRPAPTGHFDGDLMDPPWTVTELLIIMMICGIVIGVVIGGSDSWQVFSSTVKGWLAP